MIDFEELKNNLADLDDEAVIAHLNDLAASGGDAAKALEACQAGMDLVGQRFSEGEYFVADLIFAGEIMSDAAAILKPMLAAVSGNKVGKMIFCTVKNDIHDIGKNIVKALLEADGIEVLDLGVDVAPETVVQQVRNSGVTVVALSGVLTLAVDSMMATVEALKAAGLREQVKVLIGGSAVNEVACGVVGADAWAFAPTESVSICHKWLTEG